MRESIDGLLPFNSANQKRDYAVNKAIAEVKEAINMILHSTIIGRLDNDDYVFWKNFIIESTPGFDKSQEAEIDLLGACAICEIIIKEVKVSGVISSAMNECELSIGKVKAEFSDKSKYIRYDSIKREYEDYIFHWCFEHRISRNQRAHQNDIVDSKFSEIKEEKEEFERKWRDRFKEVSDEIVRNNDLLESVKSETSFAALFRGFDLYGVKIKDKIFWANVEKYSLALLLIIIPVSGVVFKSYYGFEWLHAIPFAGGFLLAGILLKVCLKRLDQLEQVMAKLEHKLAVSAFYENRLHQIKDEQEREAAYNEYYKFIFSKIETTEWNAPDITDSIVKLLSGVKK